MVMISLLNILQAVAIIKPLEISLDLSKRLIKIFEKNENGDRPVHSFYKESYQDEYFKDLILFYEYFHGDNGRGVGASHQTGWTALVANLIDEIHTY